jgi:hypothetical protein
LTLDGVFSEDDATMNSFAQDFAEDGLSIHDDPDAFPFHN